MLGSHVIVDNPRNPLVVTQLQNRNMRIAVSRQKAVVMYELFDPNQPIEQFNANIVVPVKPIHETETDDGSNSSSTQEETTSASTSTSPTPIPSYDLTPSEPTSEPTVEPASFGLNTTTSAFDNQYQIPPNNPFAYQLRQIYRKLNEIDRQIMELQQKNMPSLAISALYTLRGMIVSNALNPILRLERWYEDLLQLQNRYTGSTVNTITTGTINYYTGIPTNIR